MLAAGRALPLVRPLWDQHDTQVANVQPLVTIRIFSHFSIDINAYQLYNWPRMVRNKWSDGDGKNTGLPLFLLSAFPTNALDLSHFDLFRVSSILR